MRLSSLFFLFLLCAMTGALSAQDKARTIELRKGQVFDIILFNYAPDSEAAKQRYFKEAFPIAMANGYAPGPGFAVKDIPTQGNYWPELLVTGTWPSIAARTAGLRALEAGMADFHPLRREIWSTFNMTYYEMKKDVSCKTEPGKYYVATLFWADSGSKFGRFIRNRERMQRASGGKTLITLSDGISPFGYHYNPDIFTITEWENEAAFRAFLKEDRAMDHSGVRHLNQFRIQ